MKIITALNNPKINKKLRKDNRFKIVCRDIQYKEAIIEILEKIKNIDLIIINEKIYGEIELIKLIEKIKLINKKIKIIIIIKQKDIFKEKLFRKKGIKEIYCEKEINYEKIIEIINKLNNSKLNKSKNKINKINKNKVTKIISIFGNKESGKTTITILLIYYLINKNKKILLINSNKKIIKDYFNYKNNKKRYYKNKFKDEKVFLKEIKINKKLDVINSFETSLHIDNKNFFSYLIKKYNKNYDYILVDTQGEGNVNLYSEIIKNSDKIIITIEGNLLSIKKIDEFLKNFKNFNSTNTKSLHIIENKYYFNSINNHIIKNLISGNEQIYKIYRRKKYKDLIQDSLKKLKDNKEIKLNKCTEKTLLKIIK